MKILIIRLSSLGDVVITQPVVADIIKNYPNAEIDYLVKPAFAGIVESFGLDVNIILYQNKKRLFKQLKNSNYDLCIDLHSKLSTWFLKKAAKAKKTVTYKKHHFLRWLIVKKYTKATIESTLSLYQSVLPKIGIKPSSFIPKLIPEENIKFTSELFRRYNINQGKSLIGIFPSAAHATKQYPFENFAELINAVPDSWNCQFVLMGSHSDKYPCSQINRLTKGKAIDISGTCNPKQLCSVMNKFDAFICNDSGPAHISAGLQKPQITIFGATSTALGFAPINPNGIIIEQNLKCQPCSLHGGKICPKGHYKCMKLISSEFLLETFKDIFEKKVLKL